MKSGTVDIGARRSQRLWVVLAGLFFLGTVGLGYLGFDQYHRGLGHTLSGWDLIYLSIQLFTLESGMVEGNAPGLLVMARMMAALFSVSAVLLALGSLFRSEIQDFRLNLLKGHTVVCGVGVKAQALIQELKNQKCTVVLVDLNTDKRVLQNLEGRNVYALDDDATRPDCLEKARVHAARNIFITTGNDSTNIEIASQVIHLMRKRKPSCKKVRPTCHIHLSDAQTTELFRRNPVFRTAEPLVDIRVFNVYDNAARLLWRRDLMVRGPLEPAAKGRMHVVIGGMGQMAEAILLRIARSGHYANGRKPAVTLIDPTATSMWSRVCQRYPMIESICDIETIDGDISMPGMVDKITACLAGAGEIGSVVLCTDLDHENFATALQLASSLGRSDIPILARFSLANGLAELLDTERSDASRACPDVGAYGLVSDCCSLDAITEGRLFQFAHEFHQAYVRDRLRAGADPTDAVLKDWDDLDEQFRESNRELAEHMELKLRTFGYSPDSRDGKPAKEFTEEQVFVLSRMEHARWCAERFLAGWTYAPPPQNPLRRTSPYLVPWEQLDKSIQKIDSDNVRAIPVILGQVWHLDT